MNRKFCFVCGEKTDDLTSGKCKKCYYKNVQLIKVPEEMEFTQCSKCGLIKVRDRWRLATFESIILDKVKSLEDDVELELKRTPGGYKITAQGGKKEVHDVNVKFNKMVCPICARKFTQYHNAIIQLRGNYNDEVIDFIDEQLFLISKKDVKAFYSMEKLKEGLNIKIGSKSAAKKVVERLKTKWKFKIRKSYRLLGKKKGDEIYRDFIALRFD
ncbi:MAG: 60S ribosomal export protein NMD3 [Nanoarchaeota archaeon]|nr:60S ribosomal export protein NMD3 [Nanoarchaeota archaeon]